MPFQLALFEHCPCCHQDAQCLLLHLQACMQGMCCDVGSSVCAGQCCSGQCVNGQCCGSGGLTLCGGQCCAPGQQCVNVSVRKAWQLLSEMTARAVLGCLSYASCLRIVPGHDWPFLSCISAVAPRGKRHVWVQEPCSCTPAVAVVVNEGVHLVLLPDTFRIVCFAFPTQGQCCDPSLACGGTCCSPGMICLNSQCQAGGSTVCGGAICPPISSCQSDVCCPSGQTVCGTACCNGVCNGNLCCNAGSSPCGAACCSSLQTCINEVGISL